MTKKTLISLVLLSACNMSDGEPSSPPTEGPKTSISEVVEPTGEVAEHEVDYSSGPPERVFQCERPAHVSSDFVGEAFDDPSVKFEIRYTTECASTLWAHDAAGATELDSRDRVYTVAGSVLVGSTRVACFGVMNLGQEVSHAEGIGHHIESTEIECATLGPAGWSVPKPVASSGQYGIWLLGLEKDEAGVPVLVTMRDSLFSPAVMSMRGRPSTDGFWQHSLALGAGGAVTISAEAQRAPLQFENH